MNMDFLLSEQGLPALIIVLSPVGAFIIDLLFRFVFKRFAGKTKNTFDDTLIGILHQPIFYSVFFYVRYGVSYRDLEEIMADGEFQ